MSKERFNKHIDAIDVPEDQLIQREKEAFFQVKKKRQRQKATKFSSLIACGLCIIILGCGFISPSMAKKLSHVPIIGPIYAQFDDIASETIAKNQLATPIEKRVNNKGLTMRVKEAAYDGGRIIITVEYESDEPISLDEEIVGVSSITINGQEVKVATGTVGQQSINAKTIIEHREFTLAHYNEFGDHINVAVHGTDLFGKKGRWNVSFPLTKIDSNIQEFTSHIQAQTKDNKYALTVNKVVFSPLSTRIDLALDYSKEMDENDTWPSFEYIVTYDKGKEYKDHKIQVGQVGINGHHNVLILPPMDPVPKYLTIEPVDNTSTTSVEDLKVTIPIKE